MHAIISMQRGETHWMLNDADAKQYGTALANVLRHFPVQTSQKAVDFAALAFCIFQFETPRVALSMQLMRQQQQRAAQPAGATVYNLHPHGPPPRPNGNAAPASGGGGQASPPMPDGPPDGLGGEFGPQ